MPAPPSADVFLTLFEAHRKRIRWVINKVLFRADPGGVDDVLQVTFIKCRRSFQPALAGSFTYWIMTAAKRNALNRLKQIETQRRKGILPETDETDYAQLPANDADPFSLLLRKELSLVVEEAIASLTAEHAGAIFRLWIFDELEYREIARTLGIPIGTVMSSLSRSKPKVYAFVRERLGPPSLTDLKVA